MFTQRDKIKESAEFFVKDEDTECLIFENEHFPHKGVAMVITCRYNIKDLNIEYNKWFVECFDIVKNMGLPGTELHDNLVKGTGVTVSQKKAGMFKFYKKDALDIINACEYHRDISSMVLTNHKVSQK